MNEANRTTMSPAAAIASVFALKEAGEFLVPLLIRTIVIATALHEALQTDAGGKPTNAAFADPSVISLQDGTA